MMPATEKNLSTSPMLQSQALNLAVQGIAAGGYHRTHDFLFQEQSPTLVCADLSCRPAHSDPRGDTEAVLAPCKTFSKCYYSHQNISEAVAQA